MSKKTNVHEKISNFIKNTSCENLNWLAKHFNKIMKSKQKFRQQNQDENPFFSKIPEKGQNSWQNFQ